MTLKELIEKLSAFENQSSVCVEDTYVWINTRFDIKNVFVAEDGVVIIQTQSIFYDEEMNAFIIDSNGDYIPA